MSCSRREFFSGASAFALGAGRLFAVGNHELRGSTYGGKGMFVKRLYPDPEERARHVLASDMAGNWQRIWGEKYEQVWHKVVNGFHFFGIQWGVDDAALIHRMEMRQFTEQKYANSPNRSMHGVFRYAAESQFVI